jgi:VWFA-related protein
MFTRRFLLFVVLASTSAFSQGHPGGGGGGTPPKGTTPTGTSQPSYSPPTRSPSSFGDVVTPHTAEDEGKIEFRTQTVLIQVPVVVTDKTGNHIHGLTKDDFRVLENGKQQKVSAFEELVTTSSKFPVVALKPGQFANLTLSEQQPRTVTVIALDTVNTPFLDQTYGRRQLVKYLADNLDTSQVLALMIITSRGVKVVQGLTGDPEQLLQVLKKVSGEMPGNQGIDMDAQASAATGDITDPSTISPSDSSAYMQAFVDQGDAMVAQFKQAQAIETTMNAFQAIAWSLSGVPGRKSLIWATGGFPFIISSPDVVPGGYLSAAYERTMQALSEAQISVYPVDVRGLTTLGVADASRPGDAFGPPSQMAQQMTRRISNRMWLQQSTIESLNEFADMTGGKAFYNTNDLAASFKRAADDSSSYYLLGYYLDMKNNHAGWRQLKVQVEKKDVEVRARKGFFVTNATIHAELTKTSDISYALNTPIEGTGVSLTVEWSGLAGEGGKKKAVYLAHMPANALAFDPTGQNKLDFDFAAVAYGEKDGKQAAISSMSFSKSIPEDQVASVRTNGLDFRNTLELAPGKYTVRFVVRDNVTGKVGSVTAPLTVN